MTKQEKLMMLDNLILDRMIKCIENDETHLLPELTSAISYVAKNNLVADKQSSTVEDEIAKRVKEANARRAKDK